MQNLLENLKEVLSLDAQYILDGKLFKNKIVEHALKPEPALIKLLLKNKTIKENFFTSIDNVLVFDKIKFQDFVSNEEFLPSSYTKYKKQLGLSVNNKLFSTNKEVSLVWAYKDCVLEGGQTKEDEGKDEIFYNETLSPDEINLLLEPKVLTKFELWNGGKKHKKVEKFNRNEKGIITDNLLIKGNNLLALHTIKKEFAGQVKVIYIDPPYNTGNDGFKYNDNFNHSTWLTFMKNRLEVARELLRDDGVIFVQCDHHEIGYLNVLLDEIFEKENKIQQIAVKVASASGFKAVNPGPIDVLENILFYAKNKKNIVFEKSYVVADYHRNYNQYLDNKSKNVDEWKLIPLKEKVLQEHSISEKELRVKFGDTYTQIIERMIKEFAFVNAKNVVSIRDLHKPTLQVKELQEKSRKIRNKFFVYKKQDGDSTLIINGGAIAFYSSKIREIDGALQVTELLTNFWDHVSWAGIANEGGVTLKNGKKPEKLLKQLIEIACDKNDIILDFFVGSGTTAAVAHKMGRQYIGIEQLDYGDNDSIGRLKNVIAGDQTGISKSVNWQGGGSFIYCELMQWNEKIMQEIQKAKTAQDLLKIYENIKKQEFMRYEIKNFDIAEFEKLSIKHQKHILCDCIDKNHLYVNLSEIDDKKYEVSKEDKELNKKFFK